MMIKRNKIQKNRIQKNHIKENHKIIPESVCVLSLCCMLLGGCRYGERTGTILIGGEVSQREVSQREISVENAWENSAAAPAGESMHFGGASEETARTICVYVCGAVMDPGVVEVPEGSRAEEALLAAGGFREDAGREAVNLADWVTDGQMLYFPTAQEAEEKAGETGGDGDLVNINTADIALLCTLPGIGESRAADIIAYREKNGRFESCEDIMKVPGIKTGAYEKICDKIKVR